MSKTKVLICPYCGEAQRNSERCRACAGFFEPLSRQATHNAMGPWFIRNPQRPFQPGASYETLVRMVERGQVNRNTIIRGPTTKQFWTVARRVPGIAHLLGYCHHCETRVEPEQHGCPRCGVPFGAYLDREYLGLPDIRPLPGEVPEHEGHVPGGGRALQLSQLAPQRGSISSFASDDELVGGGGSAVAAVREAAQSTRADVVATAAGGNGSGGAVGSSAAIEAEAMPGGAMSRAMQRRLARQERTIRMLMLLLVLAMLVAGVLAALWLAPRLAGGGRAEPAPAAARGADDDVDRSAPAALPPAPARPAAVDDAIDEPAGTAPGDEAEASSDPDDGEAAAPAAPPAWQEDYERAAELAAIGADDQRTMDERIDAYTEALALLEQIAAATPEDDQPADLAERRERWTNERERLELKRYFP